MDGTEYTPRIFGIERTVRRIRNLPEEINVDAEFGGKVQKVLHEHTLPGIAGGAAGDAKTSDYGVTMILISLQLLHDWKQDITVVAAELGRVVFLNCHRRTLRSEKGEFRAGQLKDPIPLLVSPVDCRFHYAGTASFALHDCVLVNDAV
ncbi:hypothetical protein D3C81_168670 [compost metagenome]